jgi:Protein of unknown function (DUF3106)
MKRWRQLGSWLCGLGLAAALTVPCAQAQRPKDRTHVPPKPAHRTNRDNNRPPMPAGGVNNQAVAPNRVATPPPNVQERFKNMTPSERQRVLQNSRRFNQLPPSQQQALRERAQVWNKMTPEQRDHIRNDVLPRWRQMPGDRRQAIQQRLRVLQNMPEYARNQRLNDPNFTRGMSDEDKSMLRDLSHVHVGGAPDAPNE